MNKNVKLPVILAFLTLAACNKSPIGNPESYASMADKSLSLNGNNSTLSNPGTLIFNSGFEPGTQRVKINAQTDDFIGVDLESTGPNDWTAFDNHPNIGHWSFNYEGGDSTMRRAYVINDPVTPGNGNKVLMFDIKEPNVYCCGGLPQKSRIQADLYGNNNIREFYQKVRVYFGADFNDTRNYPGTYTWMTLFELWNNKPGTNATYPFRTTLAINKRDAAVGSQLTFNVDAQTFTGGEPDTTLWAYNSLTSANYTVPMQTWLTLEIYMKEGKAGVGRFYFAVTPQGGTKTVIFDVIKPTCHPNDPNPDGFKDINPIKLYCDKDIPQWLKARGRSLKLYWDDFEFWKDRTP